MSKTITFRPTEQEENFLHEASKLLGSTGKSEVIHILLKKGYEALTQAEMPNSLEESGFIGCANSGPDDVAGHHKKYSSESLNKKWS